LPSQKQIVKSFLMTPITSEFDTWKATKALAEVVTLFVFLK